ncbi:hypothetical protein ACROYT_G003794 [Oculina patagonica]
MFIRFVIFSLLICLSYEISDKVLSRSSELLRGFNTREFQSKEPSKQRDEVPRFLLNLYRKRTLLHRSGVNQRDSEIVRVFFREPAGDGEHTGPLHHGFYFNLSSIEAKEKVKKAQLRIYKKAPLGQNTEGRFKIRVLRLKNFQNRNIGVLVASHLVSYKEKVGRWISFDVSAAVKHWKDKPEENFGLSLTVEGVKAFPNDFRIGAHGKRAPFLVTYTKNPLKMPTTQKNCSSSQVADDEEEYVPQNVSTTARNRVRRSSTLKRCRRRWVYVQFKKLKWNWIIAPSGYSANYCEGICPNVLDMHLEPTNHAILQSILHRLDSRIPAPLCAPTKLHGISVLYKTSDRSIALTEYGGMVVSSCGCQ